MPNRSSLLAGILFVALSLSACDSSTTAPIGGTDIPGVLATEGDYTALLQALSSSGMQSTLSGNGPFTLFAPTDLAFEFLGTETTARLLADTNQELLARVMRHHIVPGRFAAEDLTDGQQLQTIDGSTLVVSRLDEELRVGGAVVSDQNTEADNGIIHGIADLLRDNLSAGDRLSVTPITSTFYNYVEAVGQTSALGANEQVTAFVPIDNAFELLGAPTTDLIERTTNSDVRRRLVDFHIVSGSHQIDSIEDPVALETIDGSTLDIRNDNGTLSVNGRRILSEGITTSNGFIYLIDGVILDDLSIEQRLRVAPTLTTYATEIRDRPALSTLLASSDDLTLFAVLNTGFLALDPDVIIALDDVQNAALIQQIIEVHIIEGRFTTDDLVDGMTVTAIDGSELPVRVSGSQIFIKNGLIRTPDVPVENGAFHIVDKLIVPDTDLFDQAILSGFTAHADALRRTGLEATFRDSSPKTLFAFPNDLYTNNPGFLTRPDLDQIILYHAASRDIGGLAHGIVFESLEGTLRTIAQDPIEPAAFWLDGVTPVMSAATASNGSLMSATNFTLPPALRASN